jgi:CRISPR-associated endoribonuclease Cas6
LNIFVSSPRKEIVYAIAGILTQKKNLKIGSYFFDVIDTKILNTQIKQNSIFITGTPVNISIPTYLFEKYNIHSEKKVLHWTNQMPLNSFVEALENNSIKKYEKYFNTKFTKESNLFKSFKFKNFALVPYKKAKVAASYWEFEPNIVNSDYRKLFEFLLDTGLGQRNSAGFGFMNLKNKT